MSGQKPSLILFVLSIVLFYLWPSCLDLTQNLRQPMASQKLFGVHPNLNCQNREWNDFWKLGEWIHRFTPEMTRHFIIHLTNVTHVKITCIKRSISYHTKIHWCLFDVHKSPCENHMAFIWYLLSYYFMPIPYYIIYLILYSLIFIVT